MLQRVQAMWRSWREKRREYRIERAMYRADGHRDAAHGGFDGEVPKSTESVTSKIFGGGGGGP